MRETMKWVFAVMVAAIGVAVSTGIAAAQSGGGVSGSVRDTSGGVLPGATVVLTNVDSQQKREAVTTAAGLYNFAFVPAGDYIVSVDLPGFRGFVRQNVRVNLGGTV